jgi:hypothetical protein
MHSNTATWIARLGVGVLAAFLAAGRAEAKLCGDDVDGRDVACDCGDTVVSDLKLDDDPVARTVCQKDGLVVRALQAARGISIDLNGKTLRGNGSGIGIWIVAGGPGGARVRSVGAPATIEGFDHGLMAGSADSLDRLENVVVIRSKRDGVRVGANGYRIDSVEVRDAGRDGFALGGRGYQVTNTRAVGSKRFGYALMGQTGSIGRPGAGNAAEYGADAGFKIMGAGHVIVDCLALDNKGDGLNLHGNGHEVNGCHALGNAKAGVTGMGAGLQVAGNEARDNAREGLELRGPRLTDAGGNRASGNGAAAAATTVQCAVNGAACKP